MEHGSLYACFGIEHNSSRQFFPDHLNESIDTFPHQQLSEPSKAFQSRSRPAVSYTKSQLISYSRKTTSGELSYRNS